MSSDSEAGRQTEERQADMFLKVVNLNGPIAGNFVIFPFDHHIKLSTVFLVDEDDESPKKEDHVLWSKLMKSRFQGDGELDATPFGLDTSPGKSAVIVEIYQRYNQAVNVDGFVHEEDRYSWFTVAFQNVVIYILNDEGKTVDKYTHTTKD